VAMGLGIVAAGVLRGAGVESSVSVGGSGGEEGICGDVAASFVDPSCDVVLLLEVSFVRLGREIVLGHLVQQVLGSHDRSGGTCQTSYFRPTAIIHSNLDL
jgi:hypothetical protein